MVGKPVHRLDRCQRQQSLDSAPIGEILETMLFATRSATDKCIIIVYLNKCRYHVIKQFTRFIIIIII